MLTGSTRNAPSASPARAALALCAISLATLLIVSLLVPTSRAEALSAPANGAPMDLTVQGPDHAALTLEIGSGEDMLVLLDQRAESLLMYRVRNQSTLEFRGRQDLRELFGEARRASGQ